MRFSPLRVAGLDPLAKTSATKGACALQASLRKVVVVRPGALGDVVVARGLLAFLKSAFPKARLVLVAPGERGRWLARPGWADVAYDLERRDFSWLFGHGSEGPDLGAVCFDRNAVPKLLVELFEDAGLVISFTGAEAGERGRIVGANLRRLAKDALLWCGEAFPGSGAAAAGVVGWLTEIGAEVCVGGGLLSSSQIPDIGRCGRSRCAVAAGAFPLPFGGGGYVLLHPGSGSSRKNWPLANFAELARGLLSWGRTGGEGAEAGVTFSGLALVSGEADGRLAAELREMVGAGEVFLDLSLSELSVLLSRAYLYVGNDSGVSHLSCAVRSVSGSFPRSAVIFGPSDAAVWGEEESLRLPGGADFSSMPATSALRSICHYLLPPPP